MFANNTQLTNTSQVLCRSRRSRPLMNNLNTDVDGEGKKTIPKATATIRSLDKFTNGLEGDSSVENAQTSNTTMKVGGIGRYTPDGIVRILNMLQRSKPLKSDHSQHLIGFLNELKDLEDTVLVSNLKLLKKKPDMSEKTLSNLLMILLKSDIKWPTGHLNTILRILYDLDVYHLEQPLDPKGIMHTKWEKMKPHEIAYFHDVITSGQNMSTEKYIYLTKFLSRLAKFTVRQFNDYMSFLNENNLLGANGLAVLIQFLKDSRGQWKPLDYQKLNNLLNMNVLKKAITNIKKRKPANGKTKSLAKLTTIVKQNDDKPIVHHQDNHRFNIVMESLLMDGLLNAQKLNVLENFLQTLAHMSAQELLDYLVTLKRRKIINTRIMVYLKQVLLENLIKMMPNNERDELVKAFSTMIDPKLEKTLRYPAIAKYHLENKPRKAQHNTKESAIPSAMQNISKVNIETNSDSKSNSMEGELPKSSTSLASSVSAELAATKLNSNSQSNLNNRKQNPNTRLNVLTNYKNISQVKMSPLTREKVDRLFLRLKASVYFAQRLKFFQNMFRAGENRIEFEDVKDANVATF